MFCIGAFYPAVLGISFLQKHTVLSITWLGSCLIMSVFTLLPPAMKTENVMLMYVITSWFSWSSANFYM